MSSTFLLMALGRFCAASESVALPAVLYENRGQADPAVRFILRDRPFNAYFRKDGITFDAGGALVQLRFVAANASPGLQPLTRANGYLNFLRGRDAAHWSTQLPLYNGIEYRGLYPGVDMRWNIGDGGVKSEFVIAPGADFKRVRLRYSGMQGLRIEASGAMELNTGTGSLREHVPEAYTIDNDGARHAIHAHFRAGNNGEVAFELGAYDRRQVLVIDPALSFSTFLGGSAHDSATGVAVDRAGNVYVGGWAESSDFPVTGGLRHGGGIDGFVAKFTPANTLAYCTYIGGAAEDHIAGIAVDASGNAVVAGYTASIDFPVIAPLQPNLRGTRNAFVAKLNTTGTALLFSTFLGGTVSDAAAGVALDATGNVYVAGNTTSSDFPRLNAYQAVKASQQDGFVTKIAPSGGSLLYSTFLGGSNVDTIAGIAVDTLGSAYVAGNTQSANFPVTGAYLSHLPGQQSGFITKLNPNGGSLAYSTFLGGSGGGLALPEMINGIAVDSTGAAYVAGVTSSTDFPVVNAFQALIVAGTHGFASKLNPAGNGLVFSTYLGGSGRDFGNAVAVSASGAVYVCGYTSSTDFPVSSAIQASNRGVYDAFLARFDRAGTFVYGTYLGGGSIDSADAIATDQAGNVILAGHTMSTNFPLAGAFQSSNDSNYSAFIAKIYDGVSCSVLCPPILIRMQNATRQATVYRYGGAGGATQLGASWLDAGGEPGWRLVSAADYNGDGTLDLVWQNDGTRQVKVNYYGGSDGTVFQSWNWINSTGANGWSLMAVADFNGDGLPDLVWQNDTTRQVTVHYYGGNGGTTFLGWNWLNSEGAPGWHVAAAADFNGDGVPDLVWQNDITRQVTVHYFGGIGGATFVAWNWLNSTGAPGWHVAKAADFNGDHVPDLVWQNDTTFQVTVHYFGGAGGAVFQGWNWLDAVGISNWAVVN